MGYLMPKSSLQKASNGNIWPIAGGDKRVHTFPKSINPKVNVIVQLEFELVVYNVKVIHVSQ